MREKEEVEIVDFLIQVKDCMVSRGHCLAEVTTSQLRTVPYFGSKISISQLTV